MLPVVLDYLFSFKLSYVGIRIAESMQNHLVVFTQLGCGTGLGCKPGEFPGETDLFYLAGLRMFNLNDIPIRDDIRVSRGLKDCIDGGAENANIPQCFYYSLPSVSNKEFVHGLQENLRRHVSTAGVANLAVSKKGWAECFMRGVKPTQSGKD